MKLEKYNVTVIIEDPDDETCNIKVTLERVGRNVILTDARMQRFIGNLLVQFEESITDNPSQEFANKFSAKIEQMKKEWMG